MGKNGIQAEIEMLQKMKKDFTNLRFGMFIHFNMATFADSDQDDWGDPLVDPECWAPEEVDCIQWADAAAAAGMTFACLTAKHHDGFSLWPSEHTSYSVKSGKNRTDVVRAYLDAFRGKGLKAGLYFSMLDLSNGINAGIVTPERKQFVKDQLTELLTNYGEIPFLVIDGWNAFWGGPSYREIPYEEIRSLVKSIQPHCLLINHSCEMNDVHTDVVFFENAAGQEVPDWYDMGGAAGNCLQSAWFWKDRFPEEILKPVDWVLRDKLKAFNKKNISFFLNCAPNRKGKLDTEVVKRLKEIGERWTKPEDIAEIPETWYPQYDLSGNLAFRKPCMQSSALADAWTEIGASAERAVDGRTDGDYGHHSVAVTNTEYYPWWEVDLQEVYEIERVEIWNRTDEKKKKLSDYWLYISETPFSGTDTPFSIDGKKEIWKTRLKGYPDPVTGIGTGGARGRYIRIQLNTFDSLSLAEVKVFENKISLGG